MERKKASEFLQEFLNLFDGYVHGRMSRREFLDGAQVFAVGGVTAVALLNMLKPNYAWAVQVPTDDKRIKTEYATVASPRGNGSIKGHLVWPTIATKQPAVLVIHENRGLNPYIEDVARRLAVANFIVFAPDGLTSVGGYPGDDEKGAALFGQVDRAKMAEDFLTAAIWLKSRPESTGKLGVVGFCGLANQLAVRMGSNLDAAVTPRSRRRTCRTRVTSIGRQSRLPQRHDSRYDEVAAKEAWQHTLDWFNKYLRG